MLKILTSDATHGNTSDTGTFLLNYEEIVNSRQKPDFLAHFERIFDYALLCPMSQAPFSSQIKRLFEIYNCDKFDQCRISGYQVINFQMFSWRYPILEMVGLWALFPPNMVEFCSSFDQS